MNKEKNRGFTLVEMLVVVAIISILAAIVVPNVSKYISRARATRAFAEISTIETSVTAMLSAAERGNVNHLFNPGEYNASGQAIRGMAFWLSQLPSGPGGRLSEAQFDMARQIYTNSLYALLRIGRSALAESDPILVNGTEVTVAYNTVLNRSAVEKLGTLYADIGSDPWGNLYQMWPGPWPRPRTQGLANPVPFRVYRKTAEQSNLPGSRRALAQDSLSYAVNDPATDQQMTISYPAPRDKTIFIYSMGENLISGQLIYRPNEDFTKSELDYPPQEPEFTGGGDDINNWDNGRSWEVFYN